jgi:enoyl-CoA hydratase/carnithine racemase
MEVILGAEDFDADTAERYGWVNRSIPDAELDEFVERFAIRVARFDRRAITAVKEIINQRAGLAKVDDIAATQKKFFETLTWPESQARVASLIERGLQERGDVEFRLGYHLGL